MTAKSTTKITKIIHHTVISLFLQYFYKEYYKRTLCYLKEFDSKFGEVLKQKREEIEEVRVKKFLHSEISCYRFACKQIDISPCITK